MGTDPSTTSASERTATVVARLNAAFDSTGLTVTEFADEAGMDPDRLAAILAGTRGASSLDYARFAEVTNVDPLVILGYQPPPLPVRVWRYFRYLPLRWIRLRQAFDDQRHARRARRLRERRAAAGQTDPRIPTA